MSDVQETLIARVPAATQPLRVLRLVADGHVESSTLPPSGVVAIGRGSDVQIHVSHATVSRRHAELRIEADGSQVFLTDLASANGSRLGAAPLAPHEPHAVATGEAFTLGNVLAIILDGSADARPSRSLGRDDLADFIERAARLHREEGAFSVCTLSCADIGQHLDLLAAVVPPRGHVAALSDGVICAVLPGVPRTIATRWMESVAAYFVRSGIEVASRVSSCPDDGETLSQLCPQALTVAGTAIQSADIITDTALPSPSGSAMRKALDLVEQVAATPTSILLLGETGVGKEVMARRIHDRSDRSTGPFIALNCAALPETLLESELFGYERGAFTGAQTAKQGLIEAASGGTLFLDELGEMPLPTQAKLLRVLEDRTVLRVGSVKPKPVDIRLVAATNRDLLEEIQAKRFRADLYYRLNSIIIRIPPLRERTDEIRELTKMFAEKAAHALGRPVPQVPGDVMNALVAYAWPGNVRELRNTIERLVLLGRAGMVSVDHLPDELRANVGLSSRMPPRHDGAPPPPSDPALRPRTPTLIADEERERSPASATASVALPGATMPPPGAASLDDEISRIERARIVEALEKCVGNQTRAAEMLGITRRVLIGKMEKYNLPRPRK